MNTTGKAGILCTNGSTGTWTSGNYLFGWLTWLAPGAIAAEASGGLVLLTGSSATNYKVFYVGGNVSGKYPYGGWQNFAVDPTMTAPENVGTATAYNIVGAGANVLTAVSKGNPLGFDVFRYGRGTLRVGAGDGTTPATFAGMATANDATSARWGLFEANPGVYKYKGVMELGFTACTFVDQNKTIVIDYTKYCQSNFNQINIKNASSNISWTNITITSLSTVSKGSLTVTDNPTVLLDSCTFTDMGAFTFMSNTSTPNCTFRRCGLITAGGADMTGSLVTGYEGTADDAALLWNVTADPDGYLDDMSFVKGTSASHAIEFGTTMTDTNITLRGIDFSGYSGTGTSAALNFLRTDAVTTTVNLVGCTGTITAQTTGSHNVSFVIDPVTTQITVKDVVTGSVIENARVYLGADTGGSYPAAETVTITRVTTTASVAHTGHGMANGDQVLIKGAVQPEYNGVHTISNVSTDAYDFTVSGTPTTPATGTIKATWTLFEGDLTNASGIVTDTRSYTTSQPVAGRVRRAAAGDYYKTAPIVGTISSTAGLALTIQMIPDE